MRSSIIAFASFAFLASSATSAMAQESAPAPVEAPQTETKTLSPSGFEFGARLGYALPLGSAVGNGTAMSTAITGSIPIVLDVGYRVTPNVYVGAYGQYGYGLLTSDACKEGLSCSMQSYRLGANVHYHFLPGQSADPWIGVGTGYEWLHTSASQGSNSASTLASGFEIVNVQAGGDFRLSPNAAIGPYASFSVSQYSNASSSVNGQDATTDSSIPNTSLHEWLTFGVRGRFDL